MKNFPKRALTLVLAATAMLGTACMPANALDTAVIREADEGKTITAQVGQQVEIILDASTKTCAIWNVSKITGTSLKFESEDVFDGDAVRPDGTWLAAYDAVFQAQGIGATTVEVACTNDAGDTADTFSVTVVVK
jgi:hypothetical protein